MELMQIDGAVVYPEIVIEGDAIILPQMNKEYKYALISDGAFWASKDGKTFCLAIAIEHDGQEVAMINGKPTTKEEVECQQE